MAETWRVVLASGEVREVRVEALDDGGFEARWGDCDVESDDSEHDAVLWLASCFSWGAVEILAPGELTRAELRAQVEAYAAQLAPMARVVDVLRAAAVASGHPAADGDPDAQLRAVRAQAFREGAEALRGAVVQDPHMVLSDYDERRIRDLPVPPCPEVSR